MQSFNSSARAPTHKWGVRTLAILLSSALLLTSPGPGCYRALAAKSAPPLGKGTRLALFSRSAPNPTFTAIASLIHGTPFEIQVSHADLNPAALAFIDFQTELRTHLASLVQTRFLFPEEAGQLELLTAQTLSEIPEQKQAQAKLLILREMQSAAENAEKLNPPTVGANAQAQVEQYARALSKPTQFSNQPSATAITTSPPAQKNVPEPVPSTDPKVLDQLRPQISTILSSLDTLARNDNWKNISHLKNALQERLREIRANKQEILQDGEGHSERKFLEGHVGLKPLQLRAREETQFHPESLQGTIEALGLLQAAVEKAYSRAFQAASQNKAPLESSGALEEFRRQVERHLLEPTRQALLDTRSLQEWIPNLKNRLGVDVAHLASQEKHLAPIVEKLYTPKGILLSLVLFLVAYIIAAYFIDGGSFAELFHRVFGPWGISLPTMALGMALGGGEYNPDHSKNPQDILAQDLEARKVQAPSPVILLDEKRLQDIAKENNLPTNQLYSAAQHLAEEGTLLRIPKSYPLYLYAKPQESAHQEIQEAGELIRKGVQAANQSNESFYLNAFAHLLKAFSKLKQFNPSLLSEQDRLVYEQNLPLADLLLHNLAYFELQVTLKRLSLTHREVLEKESLLAGQLEKSLEALYPSGIYLGQKAPSLSPQLHEQVQKLLKLDMEAFQQQVLPNAPEKTREAIASAKTLLKTYFKNLPIQKGDFSFLQSASPEKVLLEELRSHDDHRLFSLNTGPAISAAKKKLSDEQIREALEALARQGILLQLPQTEIYYYAEPKTDEEGVLADANQILRSGVQDFNQGNYAQAATKFKKAEEAYAAHNAPRTFHDLALQKRSAAAVPNAQLADILWQNAFLQLIGQILKEIREGQFLPKHQITQASLLLDDLKKRAPYHFPESPKFSLMSWQRKDLQELLQSYGVYLGTPSLPLEKRTALQEVLKQTSEYLKLLEEPKALPAPEVSNEPPSGTPLRKKYASRYGGTSLLAEFSKDLTQAALDGQLDPTIGRKKEIEGVIHILARRTKNNPVLLGEAGVGKTAIVEGLAQRIAEGNVPPFLQEKRILQLDLSLIVAGTKYRGQFEERLKTLMKELMEAQDAIVFIDEIHTLVGAGSAEGSLDAANILKPALSRGEIQVIGASTPNEYRKTIERDRTMERRFQVVKVPEPSEEEAIEILQGIRERYEKFHAVTYSPEALRDAVRHSSRYIPDRFLPDKAIDLIDEAGSKARLGGGGIVGKSHIEEVVSQWTGVPITQLGEAEQDKLLRMEEELKRHIVHQDPALEALSRAIRRSRAGIKSPGRPVGSFLFLGPTGVGKTESARRLAAFLFGTEKALIRFDMSEYMEEHAVSKLIGSPPGYVGYKEGGQLTERVRRNPHSVILLDEIEKAHPDIFNILLQVLEDGRLTDGLGQTVDFKNAILILTSNAGSRHFQKKSSAGFHTPQAQETEKEVLKEVQRLFNPEFINRLDEVIVFNALSIEDYKDVVDILIAEFNRIQKDQNRLQVELTPAAKAFLVEQTLQDLSYGARPLKRTIQKFIEDPLAEMLITKEIGPGDRLAVDFSGEAKGLTFTPASSGTLGPSGAPTGARNSVEGAARGGAPLFALLSIFLVLTATLAAFLPGASKILPYAVLFLIPLLAFASQSPSETSPPPSPMGQEASGEGEALPRAPPKTHWSWTGLPLAMLTVVVLDLTLKYFAIPTWAPAWLSSQIVSHAVPLPLQMLIPAAGGLFAYRYARNREGLLHNDKLKEQPKFPQLVKSYDRHAGLVLGAALVYAFEALFLGSIRSWLFAIADLSLLTLAMGLVSAQIYDDAFRHAAKNSPSAVNTGWDLKWGIRLAIPILLLLASGVILSHYGGVLLAASGSPLNTLALVLAGASAYAVIRVNTTIQNCCQKIYQSLDVTLPSFKSISLSLRLKKLLATLLTALHIGTLGHLPLSAKEKAAFEEQLRGSLYDAGILDSELLKDENGQWDSQQLETVAKLLSKSYIPVYVIGRQEAAEDFFKSLAEIFHRQQKHPFGDALLPKEIYWVDPLQNPVQIYQPEIAKKFKSSQMTGREAPISLKKRFIELWRAEGKQVSEDKIFLAAKDFKLKTPMGFLAKSLPHAVAVTPQGSAELRIPQAVVYPATAQDLLKMFQEAAAPKESDLVWSFSKIRGKLAHLDPSQHPSSDFSQALSRFVGNTVHETLRWAAAQAFYKDGKNHLPPLEEVFGKFDQIWNQGLDKSQDFGTHQKSAEDPSLEVFRRWALDYLEYAYPELETTLRSAKKSIEFERPLLFDLYDGEGTRYRFVMTPDLLVLIEEPAESLWQRLRGKKSYRALALEYKTDMPPPTEAEFFDGNLHTLQGILYNIAAKHRWPQVEGVEIQFLYSQSPIRLSMHASEIGDFQSKLLALAKKLEKQEDPSQILGDLRRHLKDSQRDRQKPLKKSDRGFVLLGVLPALAALTGFPLLAQTVSKSLGINPFLLILGTGAALGVTLFGIWRLRHKELELKSPKNWLAYLLSTALMAFALDWGTKLIALFHLFGKHISIVGYRTIQVLLQTYPSAAGEWISGLVYIGFWAVVVPGLLIAWLFGRDRTRKTHDLFKQPAIKKSFRLSLTAFGILIGSTLANTLESLIWGSEKTVGENQNVDWIHLRTVDVAGNGADFMMTYALSLLLSSLILFLVAKEKDRSPLLHYLNLIPLLLSGGWLVFASTTLTNPLTLAAALMFFVGAGASTIYTLSAFNQLQGQAKKILRITQRLGGKGTHVENQTKSME